MAGERDTAYGEGGGNKRIKGLFQNTPEYVRVGGPKNLENYMDIRVLSNRSSL